jgi:hypothetical protein
LFREFGQRHFGLARPTYRFVIHISDVHHSMHLVTAQFQMALEQVFKDIGAEVSDVRAAVNGRPASVDTDGAFGRIARFELFDLTRVRVKKAHCHVERRRETPLD